MKLLPDLDRPFNAETTAEGEQLITRDGKLVEKWIYWGDDYGGKFPVSAKLVGEGFDETYTVNGHYLTNDTSNKDLFHTKEEVIDYSEWVGKWCKFWDEDANVFCCDIFVAYCLETSDGLKDTTPFESQNDWFKNCELLPDDLQNRLNEVCK